MGRRKKNGASRAGNLTIDRRNKSGHYQGTNYSDVYRDGKAYVYTAWNDNDPEVGTEMPFDEWASAYTGSSKGSKKRGKKKRRRR